MMLIINNGHAIFVWHNREQVYVWVPWLARWQVFTIHRMYSKLSLYIRFQNKISIYLESKEKDHYCSMKTISCLKVDKNGILWLLQTSWWNRICLNWKQKEKTRMKTKHTLRKSLWPQINYRTDFPILAMNCTRQNIFNTHHSHVFKKLFDPIILIL